MTAISSLHAQPVRGGVNELLDGEDESLIGANEQSVGEDEPLVGVSELGLSQNSLSSSEGRPLSCGGSPQDSAKCMDSRKLLGWSRADFALACCCSMMMTTTKVG